MSSWKGKMAELVQKPVIRLVEDDKLISARYERDEFVHRDPELGPSYFWFHPNGNPMSVVFIQEGVCINRDPTDGPASLIYYENGSLHIKNYITNGKYHSFIEYAENGDVINQRYY